MYDSTYIKVNTKRTTLLCLGVDTYGQTELVNYENLDWREGLLEDWQ